MHDVYKYSPIIYMYMLLLEEYNMLFRVLAKGVKVMPHPPFLVSFPLMLLCFWHCHPPFSELWLKPWWCWDTLCLIQLCLFGYCEQTVSSDYYTCSWHLEYKCITSQKIWWMTIVMQWTGGMYMNMVILHAESTCTCNIIVMQ